MLIRTACAGLLAFLSPAPAATAQAAPCIPLPTGILTWLPGDDHGIDRIGNHNALLAGGTSHGPGRIGRAFVLDGVDDAINLGPWFNLQEFTIALWVYEGETQGGPATILDVNHTGARGFVVHDWGLPTHQYSLGIAGVGASPAFRLDPGVWHHLAITRAASGVVRLWIDGTQFHEMTGPAITYDGSEFLTFGRWAGGGRHWNGRMDEIEIYGRALDPSEVKSLVAAGSTGHCFECPAVAQDPSLVGWWTGDHTTANSACGAPVIPQGGATFAPGRIGAAFAFDGIDDSLDIGPGYQLQTFTFAFWVREGEHQASGFVDIFDTNHRNGIGIVMQKGDAAPHSYHIGIPGTEGILIQLTPGRWQHVAITRSEDGTAGYFVDGIPVARQSGPPVAYHGDEFLRIGRWGGGGRYWRGELDDLRIHTRPLASHEIAALAGATPPWPAAPSLWLRADTDVSVDVDGKVTGWSDQSGLGHHARATAGPRLVQSALNGKPALRFDAEAGAFLEITDNILTNQQFTILAVANDLGPESGFREILSNWTWNNTLGSLFLGVVNGPGVRFSDSWGGAVDGNTGAGTLVRREAPFILTAVNGATSALLYQNRHEIGRRNTPLAPRNLAPPWIIGRQGALEGEHWQGSIAEILVFDRALAAAELDTVWRQLEERYFGGASGRADLVVENVSAPAQAVLGSPLILTARLRNTGTSAATGPWSQTLLLASDAGPPPRHLGSFEFNGEIPAGDTVTITQALLLPAGVVGIVRPGIQADSGGRVPELDEDNNTAYATTPLIVLAPDLVAEDITVPETAQLGGPIQVQWRSLNAGNAASGAAWKDVVYLGTSPTSLTGAMVLGEVAGVSLPAGGVAPRTLPATLPLLPSLSPGDYFVIVVTDADQTTLEASDGNNTAQAALRLSLPPLPDLQVSEITAPRIALPGGTMALSFTLQNRGTTVASAPWLLTLAASHPTAGVRALGEFAVAETLAPGASITRTQPVQVPSTLPAGPWQFVVTADARSEVLESDEQNNARLAASETVIPAELHLDLEAAELSEDTPPTLATLTRNGDLSAPLTVTLTSSHPHQLEFPQSVIVPAGADATRFPVSARADHVVDGSPLVTLAAQAAGYLGSSDGLVVRNIDLPSLRIDPAAVTVTEGDTLTVTLSREGPVDAAASVILHVDRPARIVAPTSANLAPGQRSRQVTLQAGDDTLIESLQTYRVTAQSPGLSNGVLHLSVADNDLPSLTLALSAREVSEGGGPQAATLTVGRDPLSSRPVAVQLESTRDGVAFVPPTVILPAHQASASVPVTVVDNLDVDGSRDVRFAALVRDPEGNLLRRLESEELRVQDDDGPTLRISIATDVAAEGRDRAATAIVTRNTPTGTPLTVALASSDTSELQVPPSLIIPAGATTASVELTTPLDHTADGNQSVTVTATAPGHTHGSDVMVVTDIDLPDLAITQVSSPTSGVTDGTVPVSYRVENRGLAASTRGFTVRVLLSDDPFVGADLQAGEQTFASGLELGTGVEQTLQLKLPARAGRYWLIVLADPDRRLDEVLENNNSRIAEQPIDVGVAYSATVETPVDVALAGAVIPMRGWATRAGTQQPAAGVEVLVHLVVRDSTRLLSARTDETGRFTLDFSPLPGEAGRYTIAAAHPGLDTVPAQDEFLLVGMRLETPATVLPVIAQGSATGLVRVVNLGDTAVEQLRMDVVSAPENLAVTLVDPPATLGPLQSADVRVRIDAGAASAASAAVELRATAGGGLEARSTFDVRVKAPSAALRGNPTRLVGSMIPGRQSTLEFEVENEGGSETGPLAVSLPSAPWIQVASAHPLPPLATGARHRVTLLLSPPADLALGPYTASILVTDGASARMGLPLEIRAVSEAEGTLDVVAVDEFTYYAAGGPKVADATVVVRDAFTRAVVSEGTTGTNGMIRFAALPEGRYEVVVKADRHSPFEGAVLVQAGQTNELEAFLARHTVTYRWTVVPATLEDRTRIALETTFETFVPAPVVTIVPAVIDLAEFTGSVTQVNLTLENHGLIAARDMTLNFPDHPDITITPLVTELGVLPAQGRLEVPVTIRRRNGPALHDTPGTVAPCSLAAAACWTLPCGARRNNYCASINILNIAGDCLRRIDPGVSLPATGTAWTQVPPTYIDYGGTDQTYQILDSPMPFLPPIQFEPPQLCDCTPSDYEPKCLEIPIQSSVLNAGLEAVASALRRIPRLELEEPEADVKVQACTCCDDDGVGLTVQGGAGIKFKGKVSFGPGLEVKETIAAHGYDVDVEIVLRCNADFPFEATASVDGRTQCHLRDAEVCGRVGLDLPFALVCETSAKYTLKQNGEVLGEQHATTSVSLEYGFSGSFEYCRNSQGSRTQGEICGKGLTLKAALDINIANAKFTLPLEKVLVEGNCLQFGSGSPLALAVIEDAEQSVQQAVSDQRAIARLMHAGVEPARIQALAATGADDGVCARVKLHLDQDLVMARQAFNATLQLDNSSPAAALDRVSVSVFVVDEAGNDVTERFGLRPPTLRGIDAVNGTSSLSPNSSASASWILVPTSDAAPTVPTRYGVGGILTYRQDGNEITIPLFPAPITVHPDPRLAVRYFHQRDVLADDPFTSGVVEASEPFTLAVMVQNRGGGTARNLRIVSSQPQIIDNEKGLAIHFKIVGTEVENREVSPSLTAVFGEVPPGTNAIGRWLLTSTLQGLFTGYHATFEHLDSLGKTNLSLIDEVTVHELIRTIRAPGAADDGRPDFLVNDVGDGEDLPDTIHLSDGTTRPVTVVAQGTFSGTPSSSSRSVELHAPARAGWIYLRLPDPSGGRLRLAAVTRSDGLVLPVGTNAWTTDRTFLGQGQRPRAENLLHLADLDSTGRYTLLFDEPAPQPGEVTSSVAALPEASDPQFAVLWSAEPDSPDTRFDIWVSEDHGAFTPWLQATQLRGAVFQGAPTRHYTFYSVAVDNQGRREPAPPVPDAATTTSRTNQSPKLQVPESVQVIEGETLQFTASGSDPDLDQRLGYSLAAAAPAGLHLDSSTGQVRWQTDEGNGPGTNLVRVVATDDGQPSLSVTGTVRLVVLERNTAPVLAAVPDRRVGELQTLTLGLSASDTDLPRQQLTFSLEQPAPTGLNLDPATGALTWTPTALQGPSTNRIVVTVRDNGSPSLHASQAFTIVVRDTRPDFTVHVGSTQVTAGINATVPLHLATGFDLNRVALRLDLSAAGLTAASVRPVSASVASATLVPLDARTLAIEFNAAADEVLEADADLAQLTFATDAAGPSTLVHLVPLEVTGTRLGGGAPPRGGGGAGYVVALHREPVLLPRRGSPGSFTLFGQPGIAYAIEQSDGVTGQPWLVVRAHAQESIADRLDVPATGRQAFYRASVPAGALLAPTAAGDLVILGEPGRTYLLQSAPANHPDRPWEDVAVITPTNTVHRIGPLPVPAVDTVYRLVE